VVASEVAEEVQKEELRRLVAAYQRSGDGAMAG
jgi:hypothetical protein